MKGNTSMKKHNGAFTLVELLVVVAIISILSALALTTVSNRSEEARLAATKEDLTRIVSALQTCEADTGYLVGMNFLDNARGVGSTLDDDFADFLPTSGDYLIDPVTGLNEVVNDNFLGLWKGPYISYINDMRPADDIPEDPWGNPYWFYTSGGRVNNNGRVTAGTWFSRHTVVSLGRNGIFGDSGSEGDVGTGDDLFQQF